MQPIPERLRRPRPHAPQRGRQPAGVVAAAAGVEPLQQGRAPARQAREQRQRRPVGREPVDALALDAVGKRQVLGLAQRPGLALQPGMGADRGQAEQPAGMVRRREQRHPAALRVAHQVGALHALALPQRQQLGLRLGQGGRLQVRRDPAPIAGHQRADLVPGVAVLAEPVHAGDRLHG